MAVTSGVVAVAYRLQIKVTGVKGDRQCPHKQNNVERHSLAAGYIER